MTPPAPREPYPILVDGRAHFEDRILDTAPFIFHGAYMDGCLTRLSTAALLNVTAGGGSTSKSIHFMARRNGSMRSITSPF